MMPGEGFPSEDEEEYQWPQGPELLRFNYL
jgi:hypothetical protein